MIGFLSGKVWRKEAKSLLLDVHGVGYRISMSHANLLHMEEGKEAFLFIHHQIREDDESLYGFPDDQELHFFEKLISVSGIGPKIALEILENPVPSIMDAIETGDTAFLMSLKGIGRKTAERIIVELRGSLPEWTGEAQGGIPSEVIQALMDLGFTRNDIEKSFRECPRPYPAPEEMVRWFLQNR